MFRPDPGLFWMGVFGCVSAVTSLSTHLFCRSSLNDRAQSVTKHNSEPQVNAERRDTPPLCDEFCRWSLEIYPDRVITAALTVHGLRAELDLHFSEILAADALWGEIRTELVASETEKWPQM